MIKTFTFSTHTVRIWLNELPEGQPSSYQVLEKAVEVKDSLNGAVRQVCIELALLQLGHPSSYGLLGAEFTPQTNGKLTSQVWTNENPGERINWSLIGNGTIDEVHAGLLLEYGPSILDASLKENAFPYAGTIQFNCAAHGLAGSSIEIFQRLTNAILQILKVPAEDLAEQTLEKIARQI